MSATARKAGHGVLLVANYSNRTGYAWNNIYRLFERIALELRERGVRSWVSFAEFEPPLSWEHAGAFEGVLELPPVPRHPGELGAWMMAIRTHRIRSLYLTDQAAWSLRYALLRLAGVREIVVHSRVSVSDPQPAKPETGIRGLLKWVACRVPFIQATRVYAVSDFVRNRLIVKARMHPERVVTILNGVDLERFKPRDLGELAGSGQGAVQIFCGSRATAHKGVHGLIEAAALLRDRHRLESFKVAYAGDGPDMWSFMELAARHGLAGLFEFLGELPKTDSFVNAADIVVVPSTWGDACPSAISEALACGKPLVASRVGGVPELIGDEHAAIMVPPGDSGALAAALAGLITNPSERERLSIRARRRAERALDERRYYQEVLSQLLRDLRVGGKLTQTSSAKLQSG